MPHTNGTEYFSHIFAAFSAAAGREKSITAELCLIASSNSESVVLLDIIPAISSEFNNSTTLPPVRPVAPTTVIFILKTSIKTFIIIRYSRPFFLESHAKLLLSK